MNYEDLEMRVRKILRKYYGDNYDNAEAEILDIMQDAYDLGYEAGRPEE